MSNEAKFYNPNEVFVSLADRAISKGRAEGEFVSTDYNADSITETVGADGVFATTAALSWSALALSASASAWTGASWSAVAPPA